MLLFGQRLALANKYREWILANGVKDCPESVMAFILLKGLFNEEAVRNYLNNDDNADELDYEEGK